MSGQKKLSVVCVWNYKWALYMNPTKIQFGTSVPFSLFSSKFQLFSVDAFFVETDLLKHVKSVAAPDSRYYSIIRCWETIGVECGTGQLLSVKTNLPALDSLAAASFPVHGWIRCYQYLL